jgi:hypothetical protein
VEITLQQTEKLLKGDLKFKQFAFSMLMTHLKNLYAKDSSQAVLEKCTNELNAFLVQYQRVMDVDYANIKTILKLREEDKNVNDI